MIYTLLAPHAMPRASLRCEPVAHSCRVTVRLLRPRAEKAADRSGGGRCSGDVSSPNPLKAIPRRRGRRRYRTRRPSTARTPPLQVLPSRFYRDRFRAALQRRQTLDGEDAAATGAGLPILSGQVPGSATAPANPRRRGQPAPTRRGRRYSTVGAKEAVSKRRV